MLDSLGKPLSLGRLVIIIAVVIVIVGGVFVYQFQKITRIKQELLAENKMLLTANWVKYTNNKYKFSVIYPRDWELKVSEDFPYPKINIYPAPASPVSAQSIFKNYSTNVSIFPHGIPVKTVQGETEKSHIRLGIPTKKIRSYTLYNGDKWAISVYPKKTPDSWSKSGFIWAQAEVKNHSIRCFRGQKEIPVEQCSTSGKDIIIHTGTVDKKKMEIEEKILRSIEFTS